MAEDWITVQDAVKQSGYDAEHLRDLARLSKIKGRKVSIVWLISRKSLDGYLREQAKRGAKRGRKPLTSK
jgi:hypothetical protein